MGDRTLVRAGRYVGSLLALVVLAGEVVASHLPLDRDPQHYFAFASRNLRVKNLRLQAPGCNIGVNCAGRLSSSCGILRMTDGGIGAPGQLVADRMCASQSFYQVFRNVALRCPSPSCLMIQHPGPGADCTESFASPILGDLDGDGRPSCGEGCVVDRGDLAVACGVPLPFPACDPSRYVLVQEEQDCGSFDVTPGNRRCDLAAGTYGNVDILDGGRLDFAEGTTVICGLRCAEGRAHHERRAGAGRRSGCRPGEDQQRVGRGWHVRHAEDRHRERCHPPRAARRLQHPGVLRRWPNQARRRQLHRR
jgi:hypothetical protein